MTTICKPTTEEVINAYRIINTIGSKKIFDTEGDYTKEEYNKSCMLIEANEEYLCNVPFEDYNKENFQTVINSIKKDGRYRFNMSTFIGVVTRSRSGNRTQISWIGDPDNDRPDTEDISTYFNKTTKAFNCTSVGCIAGFATGSALKWSEPEWLTKNVKHNTDMFENIACSYLNIPISVGKMLFYGDAPSVFAWVKYSSNDYVYSGIRYTNENDEEIEIDENDKDWDCYNVNLSSIDYLVAASILTEMMNGSIRFKKLHKSYMTWIIDESYNTQTNNTEKSK